MIGFPIPDDEQDNVIGVLWRLLRNLEENTTDNVLDKRLVEQAYDLLNRIEVTKSRPRWENNVY